MLNIPTFLANQLQILQQPNVQYLLTFINALQQQMNAMQQQHQSLLNSSQTQPFLSQMSGPAIVIQPPQTFTLQQYDGTTDIH